ncbi:PP2C family protein-serine/threonine phosphatase [Amycolatopsis magusensis]|uniref:PP2C family protein-serine/threonine phosphatase n=1 Tax=Amycolatopsis magusensis TaxID=882444 RepID=UPI003C2E982F
MPNELERPTGAVVCPEVAAGAWLAAPDPAVVLDAGGLLESVNEAAALLFPGAETGGPAEAVLPAWLAGAGSAVPVSGQVDGRSFTAHPVRHEDGRVSWWLVEDTGLRLERERAAFLSEASNALLSSLNLKRCMEVTAELSARYLADAAVVISPVTRRRHPMTGCVRGGRPQHAELLMDPADVPGLSEALQGFPPVPSRWLDPQHAPAWLVPEGFGEVGSIVVTPLPGQGVPAGALVLLRHREREPFADSEEAFARLFAARAGAAMAAARLFAEQTSITEALMRELLPPVLPEVAGVEFAGGYRASQDTDRVGGDFYDVHPALAGGEETLAILGDVCGKGLEAAVLTGKVRNTLHALLPLAEDHHRMLGLLNGALLNSHNTRFVTLVLASVARDGTGIRLRLTSAGHPPPLVVRADGRVEEVPTAGTVIGVLPEIESVSAEARLEPGESCLLFTDGIIEAKGGPLGETMFGEERLRRVLGECAGMPAEAVAERVQMLASEWAGRNPHDDMAVLVITAPRGQHLTAVGGLGRGRYTT